MIPVFEVRRNPIHSVRGTLGDQNATKSAEVETLLTSLQKMEGLMKDYTLSQFLLRSCSILLDSEAWVGKYPCLKSSKLSEPWHCVHSGYNVLKAEAEGMKKILNELERDHLFLIVSLTSLVRNW